MFVPNPDSGGLGRSDGANTGRDWPRRSACCHSLCCLSHANDRGEY